MYWSHGKLHREVRILRTVKVRSNKHHQQKGRRPFEEPVSRLTKLGDKVLDPPHREAHRQREGDQAGRQMAVGAPRQQGPQ